MEIIAKIDVILARVMHGDHSKVIHDHS